MFFLRGLVCTDKDRWIGTDSGNNINQTHAQSWPVAGLKSDRQGLATLLIFLWK